MEFRNLEVIVNSAKDLKNLRWVTTMDVYVVVSLSGGERNQVQQTRVLQNCGPNPQWGQTFSFNVDEAAALAGHLTLKFEIKDDHKVRGRKDVGWVDVPVKKLLEQGGGAEDGEPKVMRDSVRLPSGETKGVLEFSYKFGKRVPEATPPKVIADPAAGGLQNAGLEKQRERAAKIKSAESGIGIVAHFTGIIADGTDVAANVSGMVVDDSSHVVEDEDKDEDEDEDEGNDEDNEANM